MIFIGYCYRLLLQGGIRYHRWLAVLASRTGSCFSCEYSLFRLALASLLLFAVRVLSHSRGFEEGLECSPGAAAEPGARFVPELTVC